MSTAKFSVYSTLDSAGGMQKGTFEVDRETGVVTVRPHRSRVVYEALLNNLATLVCKQSLGVVREEKKLKKLQSISYRQTYTAHGGTEECVEQMTADSKSKPRSA